MANQCASWCSRITMRATEVQLFSGLVIERQFELPSCPLNVRFLEVIPGSSPSQPFEQRQRFSSALRVPVHTSDDWDSIELNELSTPDENYSFMAGVNYT